MMGFRKLLLTLALGWLAGSATPLAAGQESASGEEQADQEVGPPRITEADIEAGLSVLATSTDLGEEDRAQAEAEWKAARSRLSEAARSIEKASKLEEESAAAPEKAEELKARLAETPLEVAPEVPPDADLKQIDSLRKEAGLAAEAAEGQADSLEEEQARRETRLEALPELIEAVNETAQAARDEIAKPAPEGQPSLVREARRANQRARLQAAEAQARELRAEQLGYQAGAEVLQLRRDLARREQGLKRELAAEWETLASDYRRAVAAEARGEDLELRRLAAADEGLLETVIGIEAGRESLVEQLSRIDEATKERDATHALLVEVEGGYKAARLRYQVAGGTFSMGELLRRQMDTLPDVKSLKRESARRHEAIVETDLESFDLKADRARISDVGVRLRAFRDAHAELNAAELEELADGAREIFLKERELAEELRTVNRAYARLLDDQEAAALVLIENTEALYGFIAQRILWVRSIERQKLFDYSSAGTAFSWWIGAHPESKGAESVSRIFRNHWIGMLGVLFAVVILFGVRKYATARMVRLAPLVADPHTDSIRLTFKAMLLTALMAAPIPVLVYGIGWVKASVEDPTTWLQAWNAAFAQVGIPLIAVFYFAAATRAGGLAETHFRWPKFATARMRRDVLWLIPVLLVAHFLMFVLLRSPREEWSDSLGRLSFIAAMIVLAVFMGRWTRPHGPVLSTFLRDNPNSPVARFRYLWVVLGVGFPLLHALLALAGFYYTARNLELAVGDTIVFVASTVILFNLGLRWLYVARRRLAMAQAQRRREQRAEEAELEAVAGDVAVELDEEIDIPAVDAQTRSMLRAAVVVILFLGLFRIWGAIVPSLMVLDRVQFWPTVTVLSAKDVEEVREALREQTESATQGEQSQGSSSATPLPNPYAMVTEAATPSDSVASARRRITSITLADISLALIFAILTILAARNIPGLLEITVLKRLPVDAGSRYAITTIARYVIAILGATLAFGAVHVDWESVKWLAAALTFGLAFGLQEIFANFISGLIILLERPVRVGDTVTVGTVSGTVARIRMRATTVVDFDNREYLVPNKQLIIGEVTNWTLSDQVTRVVFPVGVEYGSDTRLVRRLLMRAGNECPSVMHEPSPYVLFCKFDENALKFELRVFIASRAVWIDTMNDVHQRVDDLFREHGVVIALPQLDLRMRAGEGPPSPAVES